MGFWSAPRCNPDNFTEWLAKLHQILVHVPWSEQSPHEIAREAADILKKDPNQWPIAIVWYGENSTPPFKGPAWQR